MGLHSRWPKWSKQSQVTAMCATKRISSPLGATTVFMQESGSPEDLSMGHSSPHPQAVERSQGSLCKKSFGTQRTTAHKDLYHEIPVLEAKQLSKTSYHSRQNSYIT